MRSVKLALASSSTQRTTPLLQISELVRFSPMTQRAKEQPSFDSGAQTTQVARSSSRTILDIRILLWAFTT
eukprot:g32904.t1